ncbi:hypothetical protein JG688_00006177 [Phytophthora aleatoria]|uniref:Ubiquitin-like protease family profile domain-containing protein n=1 Tax=Phytophthora aleatoria TaxID=2496075 RepID=A0A8J5IR12_9STRA|nr:hypothetical protein JG688_00006177 [Phytophthora aleatoria]
MERQIVWTYDSFHRQDFLDDVESTINSHFMPLMMTRLLQRDGHSCGVLVVHWFEMYLTIARTTSPDHGIPMTRGDKLGREKLKTLQSVRARTSQHSGWPCLSSAAEIITIESGRDLAEASTAKPRTAKGSTVARRRPARPRLTRRQQRQQHCRH